MIIRPMTHCDSLELEELSSKYFPEFNSPEFEDNYFFKFVVTDNKDEILIGGGLRALAEVVLVTDKSRSPFLLHEALLKSLATVINAARNKDIDFLHAFVKDEKYGKHLINHGFSPVDGQALSLWVKNGS